MVEVRWTEWIDHPSHFRISFDADGQDSFIDPAGYDDFYTNATVLLDNIMDGSGVTEHTASITLPSGLIVSAIVAVNAVGDIIDPASGKVVAGVRNRDGTFADARLMLRGGGTDERCGESCTQEAQGGAATEADRTMLAHDACLPCRWLDQYARRLSRNCLCSYALRIRPRSCRAGIRPSSISARVRRFTLGIENR